MISINTVERRRAGLFYGLGAYLSWGVFPLYWQLLDVPSSEILAHRIAWSLVFVTLLLKAIGYRFRLPPVARSLKGVLKFVLSAVLIGINWWLYIWAVQNGFVVEASLGYFISPLMSILVGMVIFGERLSVRQGAGVSLSFLSVLYLSLTYGRVPWVALTLALSFALYGVMRKTSSLESLEGLFVESLILFAPALYYIVQLDAENKASFLNGAIQTDLLLVLSGALTALPLIWFAAAARRLPLATLGMLQYIAPSCQFLLGVFWFKEPCDVHRLLAFIAIWFALFIFSYQPRKDKGGAILHEL
ncbi:MAG: EamA family transporter RarD [Deltaproteobacteria bacterium]|nr:EamA family transporter RarD [Deltaproteobacteria bacterium]